MDDIDLTVRQVSVANFRHFLLRADHRVSGAVFSTEFLARSNSIHQRCPGKCRSTHRVHSVRERC